MWHTQTACEVLQKCPKPCYETLVCEMHSCYGEILQFARTRHTADIDIPQCNALVETTTTSS